MSLLYFYLYNDFSYWCTVMINYAFYIAYPLWPAYKQCDWITAVCYNPYLYLIYYTRRGLWIARWFYHTFLYLVWLIVTNENPSLWYHYFIKLLQLPTPLLNAAKCHHIECWQEMIALITTALLHRNIKAPRNHTWATVMWIFFR